MPRTLQLVRTLDPHGVSCAYCKAIPGTQCTNRVTGGPMGKAVAHPCRIRAADKVREANAL